MAKQFITVPNREDNTHISLYELLYEQEYKDMDDTKLKVQIMRLKIHDYVLIRGNTLLAKVDALKLHYKQQEVYVNDNRANVTNSKG